MSNASAWMLPGGRALALVLGAGLVGCSDLSQKPTFDTDPRGITNDDNGNDEDDADDADDEDDEDLDTADRLDTSEVDTDGGGGPGPDTDTGGGGNFFDPAQAFMFVEWAYDDDGNVRAHRIQGTRYPPAFVVTLVDSLGAACELRYNLDPTAFETWLLAGSSGVTDFSSFLGAYGLYIGMALDAGLYTGVSTCNLDPALWTADPHTAFLGGQWNFGAANELPESVADELEAAGGVTGWFGAGTAVTEEQVVGGYLYVPATHPSAPPRQLELLGIAADIDAQGNAQLNGNFFVLLDAADLWDPVTGPRRALIRMDCMWLFNL